MEFYSYDSIDPSNVPHRSLMIKSFEMENEGIKKKSGIKTVFFVMCYWEFFLSL